MPELLVRAGGPTADGPVVRVTPAGAGWAYVGFEVHHLAAGERRMIAGVGCELCLVILGGHVDVSAGRTSWSQVGGRANVFDGLPHAIYVPAGLEVSFTATTASAEVAVGVAPGWTPGPARLIAPDAIQVEVRGHDEFERFVRPILMDDSPADSLLVVEVITPAVTGRASRRTSTTAITHPPRRCWRRPITTASGPITALASSGCTPTTARSRWAAGGTLV